MHSAVRAKTWAGLCFAQKENLTTDKHGAAEGKPKPFNHRGHEGHGEKQSREILRIDQNVIVSNTDSTDLQTQIILLKFFDPRKSVLSVVSFGFLCKAAALSRQHGCDFG
jgi:hypothetical protein